jgi:hypothetical protein
MSSMSRTAPLVLCVLTMACSRPAENPPATAETPAPSAAAAAVPVKAGWETTQGIQTPESIYFDPQSGFIFSSQIAGAPDARDGNGRIAKLNGDGTMVSADWVTGLNAPKGLRACAGTLWTADIDEVIGVEIASGRVTSRVKVPDAKFLNDVACTDDGTVYVSDMLATRIIAVKDGKPSVFAQGEQLEYPNGILAESTRLIVGGWGKPEADFSTKVPGRLFMIDLKTKAKTLLTMKPFANIDGLEPDGRGGFLVSDWNAGKIFQVSSMGDVREVRTFTQGTADIGFEPNGNVLLVPHMNDNKVAAYDIATALK